jgi:hypothetical protein
VEELKFGRATTFLWCRAFCEEAYLKKNSTGLRGPVKTSKRITTKRNSVPSHTKNSLN